MTQSVRAITVVPQFFMQDPEAVARILRDRMRKEPADVWLIAVGERTPAQAVMDHLFIYGPAEPDVVGKPGEPPPDARCWQCSYDPQNHGEDNDHNWEPVPGDRW